MTIHEITNDDQKKQIAREVLENLKDWFGIDESRERYVEDSTGKIFFAAFAEERPVGFTYLKETGKHTVELAVIGVLRDYHGTGAGRGLFENAKAAALRQGYSFIQVKTVRMGEYEIYDDTNRFYLALGFKELEVFPTLWDENNPCQVYIMSLT